MATKHLWERNQQEEQVSYLKEMLTHEASVTGIVGAVALGALASIPLGVGLGFVPVVGALAVESIAALFVPSSPVFREMVDRRRRAERRDRARSYLTGLLKERAAKDHPSWKTYERLNQRVEALRAIARNRTSALTERDLEHLDDATVDFLGLWLAGLAIHDRWNSMDEGALKARLAQVEARMDGATGSERAHLAKAKADLEGVVQRRSALWSRAAAIDAAMLSMSDTFDEVYQRVVANPQASDVGAELQAAVARMQIEEELDLAVDSELEELLGGPSGTDRARKAAAARQRTTG